MSGSWCGGMCDRREDLCLRSLYELRAHAGESSRRELQLVCCVRVYVMKRAVRVMCELMSRGRAPVCRVRARVDSYSCAAPRCADDSVVRRAIHAM